MDIVAEDVPMEGTHEEEKQQEPTQGDCDKFQLPYKVATVDQFQLRAYLAEGPDGPTPEWLWVRLHAWCKIGTQAGRMMGLNSATIKKDMEVLNVPVEEFHFRGTKEEGGEDQAETEEECKWKKTHTLGSRALIVMLLWLCKNRSLKAEMKKRALEVLLGLATLSIMCMSEVDAIMAQLVDPQGALKAQELHFEKGSWVCRGAWKELLQNCQGAVEEWARLSKGMWLGKCITSPLSAPTFIDTLFFLTWLWCHPKAMARGQNLYRCLMISTLPQVLNTMGAWLDRLAVQLSLKEITALPALRAKTGMLKRQSDPVNRMVLMYRLRKTKPNRRATADTHEDLDLAKVRLTQGEAYIDCMMHSQVLKKTFQGQKQVSVSWDPSSYAGKEILVSAIYAPSLDQGGWLMNQQLSQVMVSDLVDELVPLARQSKLTRIEGYKELRGLSAALATAGLTLMDFKVPEGLLCRALGKHEVRIPSDNGTTFFIYDEKAHELRPQIPPCRTWGKHHCS